jgi:hypothetical protein
MKFATTVQNLASFDNRAQRYEFYTTERMAVLSGNCAWMERFSHVLLIYAYIDKIMDMWLTSITKFSDGGFNTRYSPWVWWC